MSGQAQFRCCGKPHETDVRSSVEQDADLLTVDRSVEDRPAASFPKRPLGDPRHPAFTLGGGGAARQGESDHGGRCYKHAPLHEKAAGGPHPQPPCLKGDSPSPYSCTPAVSTLTRSRSAGARKEFHTSKMRTTRGLSLSFHASCSKVSSNTQARPSRHSRVSAPTRKPHEGGTTSAMCTMKRVFVTPVCAGMRVLGASTEKKAVGACPRISQSGAAWSRAAVLGQREVFLDALAVLEQEEGAPALRVVELQPLIDRGSHGLGDVRHEVVRGLCERGERLGADLVRRGLERG